LNIFENVGRFYIQLWLRPKQPQQPQQLRLANVHDLANCRHTYQFDGSYPSGIYHIGYYNPYIYNPQFELDLAAATYAYQKSLANITGKYRYPYPYDPQFELDLASTQHIFQKSLTNYYNKYYWNYPY
jgi:hypothetical protein